MLFPPAAGRIPPAATTAGDGTRIEIIMARSGRPVARRDGVMLESGYDPERGARERADRLEFGGKRAAILFDDGFCYLARELAARGLEVLVVESDRALAAAGLAALGAPAYAGFGLLFVDEITGPGSYGNFLPADWQAADVLVVPARDAGPTAAAQECLIAFFRRRLIDLETTAWFGKRWVLNALDTLSARRVWLAPDALIRSGDWVVAGPGPGLDAALPRLVRDRDRYCLLALAPSVNRLLAAGLVPDVVATSDGGYAARLHLAGINLPRTALVLPLFAAAGMVRAWSGPVLPVSQGTAFERMLVPDLPRVPETPSVALFAFEVALACGAGRIVLAGLDFASFGGMVHARGYRFDDDARDRSSRVRPPERSLDATYRRGDRQIDGWRCDPKFGHYRDGLLEAVARSGRPVARIGTGPMLAALPDPGEFGAPVALAVPVPVAAVCDPERLQQLLVALRDAAKGAAEKGDAAAMRRLIAEPRLAPLLQLLRPAELWLSGRGEDARAVPRFFAGLAADLGRVGRRLANLVNFAALPADK